MASGQTQAGQREIAIGIADLERLYARNPSNLAGRLALADALLLSAAPEERDKKYKLSLLSCKKVYGMIDKDAQTATDYRILDAWTRVNLCLGNRTTADIAMKRLDKIGYRDGSFMRFTSIANKE